MIPPTKKGKKEMNSPPDNPSNLPAETKSTNNIEPGNTKEGNPVAIDSSSEESVNPPNPDHPELSLALDRNDNSNLNKSSNLKDLVEQLRTPRNFDEKPTHPLNESQNSNGAETGIEKPIPINVETEIGKDKESRPEENTPQSSDGEKPPSKEVEEEKSPDAEKENLENLDSTKWNITNPLPKRTPTSSLI